MGASPELQGEINRVLKKVQESTDLFDSIWNKYEADLNEEIKKLQRYRDQIKAWIQSSEIKDKKTLLDACKQIEHEMERFKICEKETKTKAFSKEALGQQPKSDPREKAKSETRDWINNVVRELESQVDAFEVELEGLTVKTGKRRPHRLMHLEASITRHKAHIIKLELILRLLDNDELSPEQVNDYLERNQEDFDDFSDVNELYNSLPLEVEALEDLVAVGQPSHVKRAGFTGSRWMNSILGSKTDTRCVNAFRMERRVFKKLCHDLEQGYGLKASNRMSVIEKVGIFVYTVAQGMTTRTAAKRFQRSADSVSKAIKDVLEALVGRKDGFRGLARDIIKPRDPLFTEVPRNIREDNKYFPYFKDAIGCIDGIHINACPPSKSQDAYIGPNGKYTWNVMAVCDFDMFFTFVSAGWEGSASDAQVFNHAISTPGMNFPHPPPGRYYLVDKCYPDREGYMVPYSRTRYHLADFDGKDPTNAKEAFNQRHSSLRSCIERCFGVLKARWRILRWLHSYAVDNQVDTSTQIDIILACFALNNYILRAKSTEGDELPDIQDEDIESASDSDVEMYDDAPPEDESDPGEYESDDIWDTDSSGSEDEDNASPGSTRET